MTRSSAAFTAMTAAQACFLIWQRIISLQRIMPDSTIRIMPITIRFCTWVIISVIFEKVYNALCAQTCAQSNHKDFQSINRARKKFHIVPPARRHGAGKILRLFTFQGESRILKKTSFYRDKNKARKASCFDRQEQ